MHKRRSISQSLVAGLMLASGCLTAVATPPEILFVRQPLPPEITHQIRMQVLPEKANEIVVPVKKYEKMELRVDLRATFQNPYDPDDIDLWAEFTAPSGKVWKIWGFYNPSSWSSLWMVRFAPNEVGTWRAVVHVRDREGTAQSAVRAIPVLESDHKGFVGIAPNKRYLQFTDGSPFYGVGLWYNDGYELFNKGAITESELDNLKKHGGNFISFFHSPLETMGTGLGRYDENRAGRLDEIFEWCEERDIQISWNIWFHSYFSETIWGGGNARYRNNPYRHVAKAEEFFTSPEAYKYKEKLHRYMVARWGYSRALMMWFIVDEINGTEGWLQGGSEGGEQWSQRIHDWFKANDPYRRPTTGTQSGGIQQWWPRGYEIFDIAAREIYELQGHPLPPGNKPNLMSEHPGRFSYLTYAKQSQDLWNGFHKPAILGECGYDHTYYEVGTPGYLEMYHNSLWAGLANGLSMTPFWWAHGAYINDSVYTRSLPYFAAFLKGIDFAKGEFKPVLLKPSKGDGWAMQGAGLTFGWYANVVDGVASETVTVPGLPDGDYDVHLYRPWRGVYMPAIATASKSGELTVTIPELKPVSTRVQNLGNDVAFKIVKKGVALPK